MSFIGDCVSYETKTLRVNAQLADRKLLPGSPLARGESCEQDSFFKGNCVPGLSHQMILSFFKHSGNDNLR